MIRSFVVDCFDLDLRREAPGRRPQDISPPAMSRYNSVAQSSAFSKDKTSYIEDFGENGNLQNVPSRHVAIGGESSDSHANDRPNRR